MKQNALPGLSGVLTLFLFAGQAGGAPFAWGDIALGATFENLAHELDLRDLNAAIAQARSGNAGKPDLGRRGYGCLRRDDAYADVTCVSHEERVAGMPAREVRLQFLEGRLAQFSITAELQYADGVIDALRAAFGEPRVQAPATGAGGSASLRWQNPESYVVGHRGRDLLFVSFELNSYAAAVKRKQNRGVFESR